MDTPAPGPLRVAVVEDQPLYRAMLTRTFEAHDDIRVVASVGSVTEALSALPPGAAHVVVLDIDLPDGNGISLGVQLRRRQPDVGILLLSAHDAMELLLDLPPDVSHGWCYLSKTSSTSEDLLIDTTRAASRGRTVLDPMLLSRITPRRGTALEGLTDRQFEVLRLLAQGLSNAGIADRLHIAEKSVQNHVNAIYATLGIDADRDHNARVRATLRLLEETGPA